MKIHGEWEISLVGNVLVRTTAGSFNEQGTLACFRDTQKKAPVGTPWAGLTNAAHWEMSSARSLQAFPQMREWAFQHGCVCLAVVVPDQMRMTIHQRQTGNLPDNLVRYFSDMAEACAWLTAKGFPFTPEDYPHADFIERTRPDH
ncbi:hypothetical protein LPB67_17710 [Undibacterium sp. Jales W-56]|uniref:hypothetical protein n=1 Tax=Undibacterium sp. Jales W-56 TaxID=2897325 RepID=UPI0021D3A5A2|nr:hypothetical protein [Undibacterium sp. Jales W-56]MCU6435619.1 hypothetical protein [Undibacterium sp. Jales W-56]